MGRKMMVKKHIKVGLVLVLALALFVGQVWGVGSKIDIVDYRDEYLWSCDGTYFYSGNSTILKRYSVNDYAASDGKDFGGNLNPIFVWGGNNPGELYIAVKDIVALTWFLYRSVDYGSTANEVLKIGYDADGWAGNGNSPTHIPNVELLINSFAWDKWNSQYLVFEYNVNGSRVDGAANDQVRLLKSADGSTWSEVAHWNTDGSNQNVTHGHGVFVDPYQQGVYLAFGDGASARSGIVKWDGAAALSSNQGTTSYTAAALGGAERYRTVKIFFQPDHIIWGSDSSSSATEVGIWRTTKDMSAATRVYNSVPTTGQRELLYGLQTNNAFYLVEHHSDTSDRTAYIYSSTDGINWEKTARWQWQDIAGSMAPKNIFSYNGYIYLSLGSSPAGKGLYDTLKLQEMGNFADDSPVCIHPVYWVSTAANGGNDSNNGWSPSTPKLTLTNIMTSGRITYGGRVKISAGNFSESYIAAAWSSNSYPALNSSTAITIFEGQGVDSTKIVHPQGGEVVFFEFGSANGRQILIKNLWIDDQKTDCQKTIGFGTVSTSMFVTLNNVKITASIGVNSAVVRVADNASVIYSRVESILTTSSNHVRQNNGAQANFKAFDSKFIGGAKISFVDNGQIELYNVTAYQFSDRGIDVQGTGTLVPIVKNSILVGTGSGYGIVDGAGLSETGNEIVNNIFYQCTAQSGLSNFSATNKQNTDSLFVNAAAGDFRLRPTSPAIDAGTAIAGLHDQATPATDAGGTPVLWGPSIGAYQYSQQPPVNFVPTAAQFLRSTAQYPLTWTLIGNLGGKTAYLNNGASSGTINVPAGDVSGLDKIVGKSTVYLNGLGVTTVHGPIELGDNVQLQGGFKFVQ